jgi:hypothetical protein
MGALRFDQLIELAEPQHRDDLHGGEHPIATLEDHVDFLGRDFSMGVEGLGWIGSSRAGVDSVNLQSPV